MSWELVKHPGRSPAMWPFLPHPPLPSKKGPKGASVINRCHKTHLLLLCSYIFSVGKKINARVWGFLEADFNVRKLQCMCAKSLSCVRCSVTPWTVAHQVPLFIGFSRQEYWGGLSCSPPGDLPAARIEPASLLSPALPGSSALPPPGKPQVEIRKCPSCNNVRCQCLGLLSRLHANILLTV